MNLRRIRKAIRQERYQFSAHSLEEMDEDGLAETDIRWVILTGALTAKLSDDPRGVRFVVRGTLQEQKRDVEVICRFLPSGLLRIITAYEPDDR